MGEVVNFDVRTCVICNSRTTKFIRDYASDWLDIEFGDTTCVCIECNKKIEIDLRNRKRMKR